MKLYNNCRCCDNAKLTTWLSLPQSPVANALFVEPNYERYPLDLNYCYNCGHLQLAGAPDPDGVFSEYRYRSGVSNSFKKHFKQYASEVDALFAGNTTKSVLEIGSNDGYLLEQFKELGWSTIGVEPSEYLIEDHAAKGVDLVTGFFSTSLVQEKGWTGKFDLICANNVLAHIPDMLDVVKGISQALVPGGTLVVECGDQSGIISGKYLDNVYHEHIDYYSPYSFSKLLERVGMTVVNVEKMDTHGVSFRLTAKNLVADNTLTFAPLDMDSALHSVISGIAARQEKMSALINGRPFVAYGAAAKAVTALYTLNMVDEKLVGVVDDNELKQNCYFPGTNIMITSPAELDKNALVVITAWNVYEDIKNKLVERGHTGEILCMQ